jgi:hypothetical protein
VRIAWQSRSASSDKYLDTGVEFLSAFDFWGTTFSEPAAAVASAAAPGEAPAAAAPAPPPISPQALLDQLETSAQPSGDRRARTLEAAWCSVIEQLEERRVFTRDELLASLRTVNQKFRSGQEM